MSFQGDSAPSRRALVIAAGIVLACLLMFLLIAEDLLDGGGLVSHDQATLEWFVRARTDGWIAAARIVSALGSFLSLLVIGVAIGLWLWRRGARIVLCAVPVVALVVGSLTSTATKAWFGRERPPVSLQATTVSLDAFPSGHATDAAAFFLGAALAVGLTIAATPFVKIALVACAASLAGLVGLSRLALAVHWLSDVVAGWALGSAVAVTTAIAAWWISTHAKRPPPRPAQPG